MAVEYLCKACRGHLNVKTSIVLSATKINSTKRSEYCSTPARKLLKDDPPVVRTGTRF